MSIGWAVKTTLNRLAQGTELTEMRRIKVNPTLIIGVDRGPFVTIYNLKLGWMQIWIESLEIAFNAFLHRACDVYWLRIVSSTVSLL